MFWQYLKSIASWFCLAYIHGGPSIPLRLMVHGRSIYWRLIDLKWFDGLPWLALSYENHINMDRPWDSGICIVSK